MALVERHPEHDARERNGSLEGRAEAAAPQTASAVQAASAVQTASAVQAAPAPASEELRAPELGFSFERLQRHPLAGLALKASGIALLMLGLGVIGALSMRKGLSPKLALAENNAPAPTASGWVATQASLLGAVPTDNAPAAAASASPSAPARSSGLTEDGRVILNLASVEDLRHLPGVGHKRAQQIVDLRQKLGKFKRPSDLLRVRGIGPRRLKQWLPKLVVDAPPEPPAAKASSDAAAPKTPAAPSVASPGASAAPSVASPGAPSVASPGASAAPSAASPGAAAKAPPAAASATP